MNDTATGAPRVLGWWGRKSLTVRILLGLAAGVLAGVFFGEKTAVLEGVARAYIGLMQMTVLPYLVVALVLGLGRLDRREAFLLARYGGLTILAFWGLTLAVVGLMPLTFPEYQSAFFFSTSLLHPHEPLSFVDLYIPANPFHSLANNLVPAVTLFSAATGIAMIGVPDKERFLAPLDALLKALGRVTHFVVELTPFGVIPIAAIASGTLSPAELQRLEVYFICFLFAAILIALVLLPLLVSSVTPFRYRELIAGSSDAMLTAFVTSNVFIVLPMISRHCEDLAARHGFDDGSAASVPEVVVPIAFNFPTAGKLLTLLFVPFAAWLAGSPLEPHSYPGLMVTGLFSYFAKAQVALPFLMDLVEIPQDLFQLYIPTTLINGKIDSAVGAMSLFAFSAIASVAMAGRLRVTAAGVLRFLVIAVLATAGTLAFTAWGLAELVDTRYTKAEVLRSMHLPKSAPPTAVYSYKAPVDAYSGPGLSAIERIHRRQTLRVGYSPGRLPFTFFNAEGALVGFDVEMASQMATDLGLRLEFVPVSEHDFDKSLASGEVDLVPSVRYVRHWLGRVRLSVPYLDSTVGLLVLDSRRNEFATPEDIGLHELLVIGVPSSAELWEGHVRELIGDTPYRLVELDGWSHFFESVHSELDAVVGMAEIATAWSLVYPEYSVVIPKGRIIQRPLAYAMAPDAGELAEVVDEWVLLQKSRGNVERAYQYWILGQGAEPKSPRWSIARDVLGWVD